MEKIQIQQQIEAFVDAFNEASLYGNLEALEGFLHKEAVFVYGGFNSEIQGKENCLRSIQDYGAMAQTLSFEKQGLIHWQWQDLVQLKFDYEVSYQIEENTHRETGTEVWTVKEVAGQWQLLWRALVYNEAI